jgi:hypothetical protein
MTSSVNPYNIDGTFPVAGQDNDSQGFRDNFTNTRNNFAFIKSELEDLQSKALLKSALNNTTLDNDLSGAGTTLDNAKLTAYSLTYNNVGTVSGLQTLDYNNGNLQKWTLGGSSTLSSFTNLPANGTQGVLRLWINCPSTSYTLQLPANCTLGFPSELSGVSGSSGAYVITFDATGDYFYEFSTVDAGTTILVTELTRMPNKAHGNLTVTGNLTTTGGRIDTSYLYMTRTNGSTFTANTNYKTFYLDSASSATLATQTITMPTAAEDGRIITVTAVCPITTVTWNTAKVKGIAAGVFSSGNTAVSMMYVNSQGFWLRCNS